MVDSRKFGLEIDAIASLSLSFEQEHVARELIDWYEESTTFTTSQVDRVAAVACAVTRVLRAKADVGRVLFIVDRADLAEQVRAEFKRHPAWDETKGSTAISEVYVLAEGDLDIQADVIVATTGVLKRMIEGSVRPSPTFLSPDYFALVFVQVHHSQEDLACDLAAGFFGARRVLFKPVDAATREYFVATKKVRIANLFAELATLNLEADGWAKDNDFPLVERYPQFSRMRAIGTELYRLDGFSAMQSAVSAARRYAEQRGRPDVGIQLMEFGWTGIGEWQP